MQVRVLKAQDDVTRDEAVSEAALALREGLLVIFPTETVYGVGADASNAAAVAALAKAKQRARSKPFTLHIAEPEEALKYMNAPSPAGVRLMHRAWPGPVTLIFEAKDGLAPTMQFEGRIGIRCPDHPVARGILGAAHVPVLASSANRAGRPAPTSADEALAELGGEVAVMVDAGPTRYSKPSTVVSLAGGGCRVLREGVVPNHRIERMSRTVILFVCTGNTDRSAMAEAFARTLLAEKYACREEELARFGVTVGSAGVAASGGMPASGGACHAVAGFGATLENHRSQALSLDLVLEADYIFCMTRGHVEAVRRLAPECAARVELLGAGQPEIGDPVAGGSSEYQKCAQTIYEALAKRLAESVI